MKIYKRKTKINLNFSLHLIFSLKYSFISLSLLYDDYN